MDIMRALVVQHAKTRHNLPSKTMDGVAVDIVGKKRQNMALHLAELEVADGATRYNKIIFLLKELYTMPRLKHQIR